MTLIRRLVIASLLIIVIAAAWLWWNLPTKVDMSNYAPADSFVYLEATNLAELTAALEHNETWKAISPALGIQATNATGKWLSIAVRAGIGPSESVILARAQIAVVIVGMNTTQEEDTLRVRPDAALIVETHTSLRRMRPTAINAVKRIATFAYGQATCTQHTEDAEYVECVAPSGDRKIVAALEGSLIVVGNTQKAVQTCLAVHRGQRPSLHTDPEMLKARSDLSSNKTLAFGYISSANAARLFSWAAPLIMGKAPGDPQLEQLLTVSAGKILGGAAWSSEPSAGGILDHFLFSLEPSVVFRLQPAFDTASTDDGFWKLVPDSFQSLTIYRAKDPAAAWTALNSAVASKLDTLSSVLFGSLLKSSLAVYGLTTPQDTLPTLGPPLVTVRPDPAAEGSVLIARVQNRERLRQLLQQEFTSSQGQIIEDIQVDPDPRKEFAALFLNDYVLMGKSENVKLCLLAIRANHIAGSDANLRRFAHFAPAGSAAIVTYTNDEQRVNSFISMLSSLSGSGLSSEKKLTLKSALDNASYALTETALTPAGIDRKTHSAFGQFSTLMSLLEPVQPAENPRQ